MLLKDFHLSLMEGQGGVGLTVGVMWGCLQELKTELCLDLSLGLVSDWRLALLFEAFPNT